RRAPGDCGASDDRGSQSRCRAFPDRGQTSVSAAVATHANRFDDPESRLLWVVPAAIAIWAAMLVAFSLVLQQTAPPAAELKPLEARIVEIPNEKPGLAGGAAAAPAPAPPKAEKRREVIRPRAVPHEP